MINSILSGIIEFALGITTWLISPALGMVTDFIGENNLGGIIVTVNGVLTDYIYPACGFFFDLIPPLTKNLVFINLKLIVAFAIFNIAYGLIMDLLSLLKKLPLV